MQPRILFALAIYLGSYWPLSLILLAQDVDVDAVRRGPCPVASMLAMGCASPLRHPTWSLMALVICSIGMLATFVALRRLRKLQCVTVTESKHIPADLLNYVIPYVVTFISLDYDQTSKLFGFAVFLVSMFWITYKTGQIALNPVLAVLGWKLFEVKYIYDAGRGTFVGRMLSRVDVEPDRDYHHGALQDVMVVREDGKSDTA